MLAATIDRLETEIGPTAEKSFSLCPTGVSCGLKSQLVLASSSVSSRLRTSQAEKKCDPGSETPADGQTGGSRNPES